MQYFGYTTQGLCEKAYYYISSSFNVAQVVNANGIGLRFYQRKDYSNLGKCFWSVSSMEPTVGYAVMSKPRSGRAHLDQSCVQSTSKTQSEEKLA